MRGVLWNVLIVTVSTAILLFVVFTIALIFYVPDVKADELSCRGEFVSPVSITGASTPLEEDYPSELISVATDKGYRWYYRDFVSTVRVEAMGLTKSGKVLGFWNSLFHEIDEPLDALGNVMVAFDPDDPTTPGTAGSSYFPAGTLVVVNAMGEKMLFKVSDTLVDENGLKISKSSTRDLNLYMGEGKEAKHNANAVTTELGKVCVLSE